MEASHLPPSPPASILHIGNAERFWSNLLAQLKSEMLRRCESIGDDSEHAQNDEAGPARNFVVHLSFDNRLKVPGSAMLRRSALQPGQCNSECGSIFD